jgi:periplasmic protein TonB
MLMLSLAMMLASAADNQGPSVARSINGDRWVLFRDYPAAALNQRRGGVVTVRLLVSRRGTVDSCDVVQSSGHADLDTLSCRLMGERGQYEAARDSSGRRIASQVLRQVVWDPNAVRPRG